MKAEKRVYLDYAAATPLDPAVKASMEPYLAGEFANPSSLYAEGRAAKLALEAARKQVAMVLGAKPSEIIFTAGGTEAVNFAIQGVSKSYPQGRVLALATEHQAVLAIIEKLGDRGGLIPVKKNGRINRDQLEKLIADNVVLLCIGLANSELGTIQPMAEIAQLIASTGADRKKRGIDLPIYLFSDGAQATGHLSLQVSRLGVDLMALNGAKIYGPKGAGALYVRTGTKLEPLIYGGGQEKGLRSGSESLVQSTGFATALELAEQRRQADERRYGELNRFLKSELTKIPGLTINNPQHSLPSIINFRIDKQNGEDLVYKLDAAGFAVATGAACGASNNQPSHVLLAIGLTLDQANSSLRLTLGRSTTQTELDQFIQTLRSLIKA
ncbi:MAG TPA: cysteine desulfurase family protein [Candidatus Saccharimonadales bacterium]|nr:cysteine desulfurase family protein [Candidatus Saccharimonadales bacterium]